MLPHALSQVHARRVFPARGMGEVFPVDKICSFSPPKKIPLSRLPHQIFIPPLNENCDNPLKTSFLAPAPFSF